MLRPPAKSISIWWMRSLKVWVIPSLMIDRSPVFIGRVPHNLSRFSKRPERLVTYWGEM